MAVAAQPGDVVLVARLWGPSRTWVSRSIQRLTGSWYSHAIVVLDEGRFAHAIPAPGGSVVILESDAALARLIQQGTVYDLFRGDVACDRDRLEEAVAELHARSKEPPPPPAPSSAACGRIHRFPGVVFSDGNLLALAALKTFETNPEYLVFESFRKLRDAVLVAAEDGEGRLLCSGFSHRVLDLAGARPATPPPGVAFLDLSDFPTDDEEARRLGPPFLADWLMKKLKKLVDFDKMAVRTCEEVVHVVRCHLERGTPVPDPLHRSNFTTPSDLALSPSLHRVASRYRLVNGQDIGWATPLDLEHDPSVP